MLLFKELKDCLFLALIILYDNKKVERDSHKKYFLPRVTITNYNVLIDGKNIYDQPIGDQIKNMMKLDKLQQDKERFTQQDICYIINTKY